jgi:hypothetical protein
MLWRVVRVFLVVVCVHAIFIHSSENDVVVVMLLFFGFPETDDGLFGLFD